MVKLYINEKGNLKKFRKVVTPGEKGKEEN